jgi:hypothetical protein
MYFEEDWEKTMQEKSDAEIKQERKFIFHKTEFAW